MQDVAWHMTAKIVFAPRKLQSNQHETLHIQNALRLRLIFEEANFGHLCLFGNTYEGNFASQSRPASR